MSAINCDTAVLTLYCKDVKGIVYHVSHFIFERGGNILTSNQHYEELDSLFFMRVAFDCSDIEITREAFQNDLVQLAERFGMTVNLTFSDEKKRMAIMVSGYNHCLYDLLLRRQYGELDCEVACIVSNHTEQAAVASSFEVPYFHVPVTKETKHEAEENMMALFREHRVDFVVLARYMQILTPVLLDAFPCRIINIHHGFLPAFKGAKPYHQAYEKGVKIIGATSHYATQDLDMGPIIEQDTIRVNHSHSVTDLLAMGRDIEKQVLARAVKAHIEDRIMVYKNRTFILD
ncbi:MAG: formyltetrahydrofolate deformylase [Planctomycetes bacterium]|nr:formyltetrahydrofolate deformylase [Planctomycetota bacterium]